MKKLLLLAILSVSFLVSSVFSQEAEQKTVTATLVKTDKVETLSNLLDEFKAEMTSAIERLESSSKPEASVVVMNLKQQLQTIDQVRMQFVDQSWSEISSAIRESMSRSGMSTSEIEGQLLTYKTEWETGMDQTIKDLRNGIDELKANLKEFE